MTVVDKELVARKGAAGNGRAAAAPAPSSASKFVATAAELDATVDGPVAELSAEAQAAASRWIESYRADLAQQVEAAFAQQDAAAGAAGLGEITFSNYVSYDIVSVAPVQLIGYPPYKPHKIVASGEPFLLQAIQWINPRVGPGFIVPAGVQLKKRQLQVRFDLLNLTTGIAGPNFSISITLPNPSGPVPPIIFFSLPLIAPAVTRPELIEVNVTSDIVGVSEPFSAFATWHYDYDADLPWLAPAPPNFPPTVAPQWFHGTPLRYLVYPA